MVRIEYPFGTQAFLKVAGLGVAVLGLIMCSFAWKVEYLQIVPLIFGILTLTFGVLCFSEGFNSIIIDSNGIVKQNLFRGNRIPKDQIKGFREIIYKSSKLNKTTHLIIFDHDDKGVIKCDKNTYGDQYEILLKAVRSEFNKVSADSTLKIHQSREKLYRNIGKTFGIFLFAFGLYQLVFVGIFSQEEYREVIGTLSSPPRIEQNKGRERSIVFQFKEFPEYQFNVSGQSFRMLQPKARSLAIGTELKLVILQSDYQAKIEKVGTPSFTDKHINWHVIDLYGIEQNGYFLLDHEALNESAGDPIPKVLLMLTGIGFFLYYEFISKGYD